ncbi:phage tail protein, partial [Mesorhizobium sp. M00.F.Ca.ET.186.01.1.1]
MTGSIWSWSTTAASNGNADAGINAAEGMPPSAVNDSMRQIMGREAEFLADTGGALAVGGTANAITVTANS